MVASAWRASVQLLVRLSHLALGLVAELVNTVAAVECATDLLIGLNESLQLNGQIAVLTNQNIAMVLQSVDLRLNISILTLERLVRETQVVLFLFGTGKLLLSVSTFSFEVVQLSC